MASPSLGRARLYQHSRNQDARILLKDYKSICSPERPKKKGENDNTTINAQGKAIRGLGSSIFLHLILSRVRAKNSNNANAMHSFIHCRDHKPM